ncbi:outer membrane protein assembly factor BamD, partial [Roseisolibacter sp. H3M3-2]|uniref:outer membrane protein assembly factor BamD n=1 Tax=Roseisolibacter sp. H3M3-2 TaxID=3031323 RepID=UPI0023D98C03
MPQPTSPAHRRAALLLVLVALAASACGGRGFQPRRFTQAGELYAASLREFQKKKWDNALAGFDLLATQLPARDTLLPQIYFRQGQAHSRKGEHLLSAQAYQRIGDAFPDDSLADDALYQQAKEYQALWRKPQLDAQYGQTSLGTFRQLLTLYPDSPLTKDAGQQIATLNEWFATKDYDTGMHYFRRKAYDPGLIYFRDVVRLYPGTPAARRAYFRMVDSYRAINYKEELDEVCAEMRRFYPQDAEVARTCSSVQPPSTAGQPSATRAAAAAGAPAPAAPAG